MTDQNLTPEAVKRFSPDNPPDCAPTMAADKDGDWVRASDYDTLAQQTAALQAEVERLTKERDSFRAVLQGAEYGNIDAIANQSAEVSFMLGSTVATETKRIIRERDAARAEIERLTKERDEARAQVVGAFEAAASVAWADRESGLTVNTKIRALTPDDAQAALQSMLADAERDMRQRAAELIAPGNLRSEVLALPLKHADREVEQ